MVDASRMKAPHFELHRLFQCKAFGTRRSVSAIFKAGGMPCANDKVVWNGALHKLELCRMDQSYIPLPSIALCGVKTFSKPAWLLSSAPSFPSFIRGFDSLHPLHTRHGRFFRFLAALLPHRRPKC